MRKLRREKKKLLQNRNLMNEFLVAKQLLEKEKLTTTSKQEKRQTKTWAGNNKQKTLKLCA